MRLLIKSACIAFVLCIIYSMVPFQANCENLSEDVFRFHILANSDSTEDQALKLKIRDRVLEYTQDLFNNASSKLAAESLTSANLQSIANAAYEEVLKNGYDYKVSAEIKNMYFNTRFYDGYTLPAGKYDALRITIGEGKGHNWWCVMYPSLCVNFDSERDERARDALSKDEYDLVTSDNIQYKFKIIEFFEKIRSYFE